MRSPIFISTLLILLASCNPAVEEEGAKSENRTISDNFIVSIDNGISTSEEDNPIIRVSGNFLLGQKVILYEDSKCEKTNTYMFANDRSVVLVTANALIKKGVYDFRVRSETRTGLLSPCSRDGALYSFTLDRRASPPSVFQDPTDYKHLTVTVSNTEPNTLVELFEGPSCSGAAFQGSTTSNSFGIATFELYNVSNTTHTYTAKSTVTGVDVGCSDESTPITVTAKPTAISLAVGYSTPSNNPFPKIKIDGLIPSPTRYVELYDNSTCSGLPLDRKVVEQASEVLIGVMEFDGQQKTFYAAQDGECSLVNVSYTLDLVPNGLTVSFSDTAILKYTPRIEANNVYPSDLNTTTELRLFETTNSYTNLFQNATQSSSIIERNDNLLLSNTYEYSLKQRITGDSPHSDPAYVQTIDITSNYSEKVPMVVNFTPVVTLYNVVTPSSDPFPKFSVSNIDNGSTIRLFSDSNCTTPVDIAEESSSGAGIVVDSSNEILSLKNPQSVGAAVNYYVGHSPLDSPHTHCSSAISYQVNGSQLSISFAPGVNDNSFSNNVVFRVVNKLATSNIKAYKSQANCFSDSGPLILNPIPSTGPGYVDYTVITGNVAEGSNVFYFREIDAGAGYDSQCLNTVLTYTLDRQPKNFRVTNSVVNALTPDFEVQNIIPGAEIRLYAGLNCTNELMTFTSADYTETNGTITFTLPTAAELEADGLYNFSIDQLVNGATSTYSVCSNNSTYTLDTRPSVKLALGTVSPSTNLEPTLVVYDLLPHGSRTVNLYKTPDCSGTATAMFNLVNATSMQRTFSFGELADGTNNFYDGKYYFSAKQSIGGTGYSRCSAVVAEYEIDGQIDQPFRGPNTPQVSQFNLFPTLRVESPIFMDGYTTEIEVFSDITCTTAVPTINNSTTVEAVRIQPQLSNPLTADGTYRYHARQHIYDGTYHYYSDCSNNYIEYQLDGRPKIFRSQPVSERNDLTPTVAIDDNYYDSNTVIHFYTDNQCQDGLIATPQYPSLGNIMNQPLNTAVTSIPGWSYAYELEKADGTSHFPGDTFYSIFAKVERPDHGYMSECSTLQTSVLISTMPTIELNSLLQQPIAISTPLLDLTNVPPGEQAMLYVWRSDLTVTEDITRFPSNGCDQDLSQTGVYLAATQVITNSTSFNEFSATLTQGITQATVDGETIKIYAGRYDGDSSIFDDKRGGCSASPLELQVEIPEGITVDSPNPGNSLTPTFRVEGAFTGNYVSIFMNANPCDSFDINNLVSEDPATPSSNHPGAADGIVTIPILVDNYMNNDGAQQFWALIHSNVDPSDTSGANFRDCKPVGDSGDLIYTLAGAPQKVTPIVSNDPTPTLSFSDLFVNSDPQIMELEIFDSSTNCSNQSGVVGAINTTDVLTTTQNIDYTTKLTADGEHEIFARVHKVRSGAYSDYYSDCFSFTYTLQTEPLDLNIGNESNVTSSDFTPDIEMSNLMPGDNVTLYANPTTGADDKCSNPTKIITSPAVAIGSATQTITGDLSGVQAGTVSDDGEYLIYAEQTIEGSGTSDCSPAFTYTLDGMPVLKLAGNPPTPHSNPLPDIEVTNLHNVANQVITLYLDNEDGGGLCDTAIGSATVSAATQTVSVTTALPASGSYKIRAIQSNPTANYYSECSDGNGKHLTYNLDISSSNIGVSVKNGDPIINPTATVLNTIRNTDDPSATVDVFTDSGCTVSVVRSTVAPKPTGNTGVTDVELWLVNDGTTTLKYEQNYTGGASGCSSATAVYSLDARPRKGSPEISVSSPNNNPEPTVSWSNIITPVSTDSVTVRVYDDSGCSNQIASAVFNSSLGGSDASIALTAALTQDKTYNFYADQLYTRTVGPTFTSNCSSESIEYTLNGAPTNISLATPNDGRIDPKWNLSGLISDASVHLYLTETDCNSDTSEIPITDPGVGTSRQITGNLISVNDGSHTFYVNQHKGVYKSSCSPISYTLDRRPTNVSLFRGMLRPEFNVDVNWGDGNLYIFKDQAVCEDPAQLASHDGTSVIGATSNQKVQIAGGKEFTGDGVYPLYIKQVNGVGIHTSCTEFNHTVNGKLVAGTHGASMDNTTAVNPNATKTAPDFLLSTTQDIFDTTDIATAPDIKVYHVPTGVDPATTNSGCTGTGVVELSSGASGTEIAPGIVNSTRVVSQDLASVTTTKTNYRIFATTTVASVGYESECSDLLVDYTISTLPTISISGSSTGHMHIINVNGGNLTAVGHTVQFFDNDECTNSGSNKNKIYDHVIGVAGSETFPVNVSTHNLFGDGNNIRIYANQLATDGHVSDCTPPVNAIDYNIDATPKIDTAQGAAQFALPQVIDLDTPSSWMHDSGYVRVFLDKEGRAPCDPNSTLIFNFNGATISPVPSTLNIDFNSVVNDCDPDTPGGDINECQGSYQVSMAQDIDGSYSYSGDISRCTTAPDSLVFNIKPALTFKANSATSLEDTDTTPTFNIDNRISGVDGVELFRNASCDVANLVTSQSVTGSFDEVTDLEAVLTKGTYYYSARLSFGGDFTECSNPVLYDFDGINVTLISPSPGSDLTPLLQVSNLEINDEVTLYSDKDCSKPVGTQTTADGSPITFTSAQLATGGIHEFHATRKPGGVGPDTICSADFATYDLDIEPTSLVLKNENPVDVNPSPVITANGVLANATIKLFRDANCNFQVGTASTGSAQTSIDMTPSPLPGDGVYAFHISQHISGFDSDCSSTKVDYEFISRPTDVQLLTTFGDDTSPSIRVFGVTNNASVRVYSDASCTDANLMGQVTSTGNYADVEVTPGKITTEGSYRFYAKQITDNGAGTSSQCSSAFVDYSYLNSDKSYTLKVNPVNDIADALMGSAVDIQGDLAIIGAPGSNNTYIYRYDGSKWNQEVELATQFGIPFNPGDDFGFSVDIDDIGSGNFRVIVGAPGFNGDRGKVYVFQSTSVGNWTFIHAITKNVFIYDGMKVGQSGDRFGESVILSGTNALVGVPGQIISNNTNAGAVLKLAGITGTVAQEYVKLNVELDNSITYNELGTWDANTNTPTLIEATGTEGDFYYVETNGLQTIGAASAALDCKVGDIVMFKNGNWVKHSFDGEIGRRLSLSGTTALVSAPAIESFFAFDIDNDSSKSIRYETPSSGSEYAASISHAGTSTQNIVVGDPGYGANNGQVYMYKMDTTVSPPVITPDITFSTLPRATVESGGRFGEAVHIDISPNIMVTVGTPGANSNQGLIYVYSGTGDVIEQRTKITPFDITTGSDGLGKAVSVSGNRIIFGAPNADTNGGTTGADQGRGYIFQP